MTMIPVRVMVLDIWDGFAFELPAETPIAELKARALATARIPRDPSEYLVKFRGAEVWENGETLGGAGVVPNSELIVLRRRRVSVR